MNKKDVSLKGTIALKDAVEHLENLVACLKAGRVCIQNCNEHVTLAPPDQVKFEVSAGSRESKESLSLKLTWHKDDPDDHKLELRISTEEPQASEPSNEEAESVSSGSATEPH